MHCSPIPMAKHTGTLSGMATCVEIMTGARGASSMVGSSSNGDLPPSLSYNLPGQNLVRKKCPQNQLGPHPALPLLPQAIAYQLNHHDVG